MKKLTAILLMLIMLVSLGACTALKDVEGTEDLEPEEVPPQEEVQEPVVLEPEMDTALEALGKQGIAMVYDKVHQVLAQGNFVLAVSEGTFGGAATSYYDLWRIENGKIAEHWDVMETIAAEDTWQNTNGKF